MPSIIDSLIVELNLDASKFDQGQKKAVDSLRKIEEGAKKHVEPVQNQFDGLIGSFKELQGRLLAIGALIAAGLGFNRMTQEVAKANTELGYMSKNIGMAAQDLNAWEAVGRQVGATTAEIAASMSTLNDEIQQFHATGNSKLGAFMGQVGIKPLQPNDTPESVAMRLSEWYKAQPNKAFAANLLKNQGGLSQGLINMLGLDDLKERLEKAKKFAPTDKEIKQFQELTKAWGELLQVTDKLQRLIVDHFAPSLIKVLTAITDWLGHITESDAVDNKGIFDSGPPAPDAPKSKWQGWRKWFGLTDKSIDKEGLFNSGPPAPDGTGSRGDRNNNPGNLKFGPLAQAFGATGADDKGFAIFPNYQSGSAAQEVLLKSNAYKGLTLDQFADKYAQGNADWKKTVGGALGIGGSDIVDNSDNRLIGAIRKAEGTGSPRISGANGGELPGGSVPEHVLGKAEDLLRRGASTGELQQFMASQGYPRSGNWCGEFAASVVRASGGTPPKGAPIASNWLRWGEHVDPNDVRPGDVAVRKTSRFGGQVVPGETGGHVGFYKGPGEDGRFQLEAGNQSRAVNPNAAISEYEFRRGISNRSVIDLSAARRRLNYQGGGGGVTNTNTNSSETNIHSMNVTVPHGADPSAYADGIQRRLADYNNVQHSNTGLV